MEAGNGASLKRAISRFAPDMRGFAETEAVDACDQSTVFDLLGDLVAWLDHLGIKRAAVVGHDWGAEIAWGITLLRPDRFCAVTTLSVPFTPRGPMSLPAVVRAMAPPDFYMLYFLEEGRAEVELDADPKTFLRCLYYTNSGEVPGNAVPEMRLAANGRLTDGLLEPPGAMCCLPDEHLDLYARAFERTGFRGAQNTYRSLHRTWELMAGWTDRTIEVPSFYICADRDPIFHLPVMQAVIKAILHILPDAESSVVVEEVGHFIQMERPELTAVLLVDFLNRRHPDQ